MLTWCSARAGWASDSGVDGDGGAGADADGVTAAASVAAADDAGPAAGTDWL